MTVTPIGEGIQGTMARDICPPPPKKRNVLEKVRALQARAGSGGAGTGGSSGAGADT